MEEKKQKQLMYVRWFLLRAGLVVFDVIAINASFYLALLTRFYVANGFHATATQFVEIYAQYSLFYTFFCIGIFYIFKLYSNIWRYAGLHDVNRLIKANGICFIAHVVGTLLFVTRMPLTFYFFGSLYQFILVTGVRLLPRLLLLEKNAYKLKKISINAMVVGIGDASTIVIRNLEKQGKVRPVCILDYKEQAFTELINGYPVMSGMSQFESSLEKYDVSLVVIASRIMSKEILNEIEQKCKELEIEVQDVSDFFLNPYSSMSLKSFMDLCDGEVELEIDDKRIKYSSEMDHYEVTSISSENNHIVIKLKNKSTILNDISENWVKEQEEKTGETISFF